MKCSTLSTVGAAFNDAVTCAKGHHIVDASGRTYIDLAMGMGACLLGYNHSTAHDAIASQAGGFLPAQYEHSHRGALLDALASIAPPELNHALIFNTGAEAVECALLASRRVTGRSSIIRLTGAFHGKSYLTASLDDTGFRTRAGIPPADGLLLDRDACDDTPLRWGAEWDRLMSALPHTAAVIVEAIQGSAGNIEVSTDCLRELRSRCTECDVVLVADEVACGFGRSGERFAFERANVSPDIVLGGKALSSGLPLGVVLASDDLLERAGVVGPGYTSTTFGGNSLCCAVAAATLRYVLDHQVWTTAAQVGEVFKARLREVSHPAISAISGRGLMLGIHFRNSVCGPDFGPALFRQLKTRGFVCAVSRSHIRLLPSVTLSTREVGEFIVALTEALDAVSRERSQ